MLNSSETPEYAKINYVYLTKNTIKVANHKAKTLICTLSVTMAYIAWDILVT